MSGVFVTSTHHILHITQGLLHQGESQCFNKEQCKAQLEYTQGYCHLYRPRFQHYRSTFLLLIDSTAEHCHSDRSSELVYVFHHANFQRYESFFDKPITLVSTLPVIGVQDQHIFHSAKFYLFILNFVKTCVGFQYLLEN